MYGERILGRGNSLCKGPEVGGTAAVFEEYGDNQHG